VAAAGTVIEVKVEEVLDVVGDKPLSGAARAAVDLPFVWLLRVYEDIALSTGTHAKENNKFIDAHRHFRPDLSLIAAVLIIHQTYDEMCPVPQVS